MMDITIKYNSYRNIAKTGDLILVKSILPIGKIISFCDKSYFTHAFSVEWTVRGNNKRLELLESSFLGADTGFVSKHIRGYYDFTVLRPNRNNEVILDAIDFMVNKAENGIHYGYSNGVSGLYHRFCKNYLNINTKQSQDNNTYICSQFEQLRMSTMGIIDYKDITDIFPQDYLRYRNQDNIDIII